MEMVFDAAAYSMGRRSDWVKLAGSSEIVVFGDSLTVPMRGTEEPERTMSKTYSCFIVDKRQVLLSTVKIKMLE